ncbi:MAG TPA: SRPBCC family protein [Streptosporangiaceae bacterium]|nr:SRPBCC family protein [Streptosporangiaceae bacterium]
MPPDIQQEAPAGNERVDLKDEFQGLLDAVKDLGFAALQDKALKSVRNAVGGVTERLNDYVEQGGGSPGLIAAVRGAEKLAEGKSPGQTLLGAGAAGPKEKVKGLFGGGRKGGRAGGRKLKLTNIVESIDVGVPVRVAYNQWTQFSDFPRFMKKVENVDSPSDEKLNWKAQIWWSHRTWESNIIKQVPDERIIWRSKGAKGHVDGAVSFHELSPALTRILLVLEYHPQGIFERTGNLWRAQGRRARLELKHFRRHVMTQVALHPDEVEGWRGVIEDGKVVKDHETALQEEKEREQEQAREEGLPEGEAGEEGQPEAEAGEEGQPEAEAGEEAEEERVPVGRERRSQAQAGRSPRRSTGAREAPSRRSSGARAGRGSA